MFIKKKNCTPEVVDSGAVRMIKGFIPELMVVELTWEAGQEGAVHTHPHCQCGYIIEGTFEATVGDETEILHGGDCFYAESNVPHGLVALTDGKMLDIFTPMREDFVK